MRFGWQHFQQYWGENGYGIWGPGAYVEQLVWYDEAMRQNDYVVGGCIYALAASSGWESYDILGPRRAATISQRPRAGVNASANAQEMFRWRSTNCMPGWRTQLFSLSPPSASGRCPALHHRRLTPAWYGAAVVGEVVIVLQAVIGLVLYLQGLDAALPRLHAHSLRVVAVVTLPAAHGYFGNIKDEARRQSPWR